MTSKLPVVREIAWISLVPQLLLMTFLIGVYYLLDIRNFIMWGALTYILISRVSRHFLAGYHREGTLYANNHDFQAAIESFKKSYDFFTRNAWLDKYRYLTLLTSSKMSYREMALSNIAFSYGQLGDIEKATEYYERTLAEYPENNIAPSALNLIRAAKQ